MAFSKQISDTLLKRYGRSLQCTGYWEKGGVRGLDEVLPKEGMERAWKEFGVEVSREGRIRMWRRIVTKPRNRCKH